ncbi:hypothetical protein CH259_14850 [Rhodococcus sp. 05-2254-4]|nr:hypothetical protein FQ188_08980 [Rhodococcus sp. ANT_H53B]KZF01549.1 hypothetical protein A2J02_06515 [Rhodococcus sp. EPR-147]KZF02292.1 hypothetical protein A2J04_07920 [Rhodococcus sp. EPR-279]OZE35750.1 hypothetical protein CH259_14850 [Rhodococcus sp. 05-2254-4]OZE48180.1 hypothetical protein CH261_07445 [Rhodococcus sp. 05-2254-3]OZE49392.1 hypothetical protein CH283_15230 [Rhodococcus sp. 05-2254-2]OZF44885.1 hypothetical protein CH291_20530 [Rhodococcus sp. 14-1411-2a]
MKLRNTRRAMVAGIAIAGALTMTACSSGGDEEPTATTTAVTTSAAAAPDAGAYPPVPTVEDLNAQLVRGLDPNVPVEEKAALIQGASEDPELINQVAAAAVANNAQIEITSIDDLGTGVLNAGITITLNGQANPGTFQFVPEDGVWKLSKDNACGIVSLAQLTSPACPAP